MVVWVGNLFSTLVQGHVAGCHFHAPALRERPLAAQSNTTQLLSMIRSVQLIGTVTDLDVRQLSPTT